MLCSLCGTRPAGTADVRCSVCAVTAGADRGRAWAGSPGWAPEPLGPDQLRSPVGLARAVCVLLGAVAVADVLAIAAGIHTRMLLADGLDGGFLVVDDHELTLADHLTGSAGALQMLTFMATAVVFLVWLRRVRRNAEVFDPSAHSLRPGWAIGGWFVPIGNLWLPHRVVSGVWSASAPLDGRGHRTSAPRGLLNAWWAALVVDQLVSRGAGRFYADAETGDEMVHGLDLLAVTDALDLGAAVLAILVVRRVTAMQSRRVELGPVPAAPRPIQTH
ncbi:DUF4328 domain-containing protein [Streptomyces sp. SID9727]|uniref:DUF4328 domain-containing protein n=1 Tax=Streptomyces sp. SID9727 TaxID=2706114 RepID=UPI0013CA7485|nr:DUF4328 domain-containing protein [Streptomyces sp. SID9727]NEC68421.1 DUF4328 domain-containing protein [Streptomyces sp. SID9727]